MRDVIYFVKIGVILGLLFIIVGNFSHLVGVIENFIQEENTRRWHTMVSEVCGGPGGRYFVSTDKITCDKQYDPRNTK